MSNEPEVIDEPETPDEVALLREEVESLSADAEALRDENHKLEVQNHLLWSGYKGIGKLSLLVCLGPSLIRASETWFLKVGRKGEPFPRQESARLFAAIVRRMMVIGALGLVAAMIPAFMLYQQNGLIRIQNDFIKGQDRYLEKQNELVEAQNQYLQEQNANIQRQLDGQATDTRIVRRAQLLGTIYELQDCDSSTLPRGEDCPPEAPFRLREEAVLALRQIDGEELSLRDANLRKFNLAGVDLRGSVLSGADLNSASLNTADLSLVDAVTSSFQSANLRDASLKEAHCFAASFSSADLTGADLTGAKLIDAEFLFADLTGADLTGADLTGADLTGAGITDAKLYGADLSRTRGLVQHQLDRSKGNAETRIPSNLQRPANWIQQP